MSITQDFVDQKGSEGGYYEVLQCVMKAQLKAREFLC